MRRLFPWVAVAVAVFAVWGVSRGDNPTTDVTDPKLPNIPGPFHPYNITGASKGHYHSRISEYGLEPMVMIFTRQVDFSDPLKDLLRRIDAVADKNPGARLHTFVVVESDDLPEVVGADDKSDDLRLDLDKRLTQESDALKLPHVDIDLAGKSDVEKFKLDDAGFAFFLFQRGKVTASRVLAKTDPLSAADVKAILALNVAPFGPQNTALIVTRETALSDPLKDLLRRIDDAAEKNPTARLHPILVLLSDDPMRNELAAKLEEEAKGLMLKHVEAVAAGPSDLAKYHVEDDGFAFFLTQRARTTAGLALKKGENLSADKIAAVMKLLAEKAGADK